jgi:anti-sigma B factor antagonist
MVRLEVNDRRIDGVAVVAVVGRLILDQRACPFCDRVDALLAAGDRKFLIDLSRVSSIDSAGVGALVWKYRSVTGKGGAFKLLRPSRRVRTVLEITRLDTIFQMFDSEAEAVASFEPSLTHPTGSAARHRTTIV